MGIGGCGRWLGLLACFPDSVPSLALVLACCGCRSWLQGAGLGGGTLVRRGGESAFAWIGS